MANSVSLMLYSVANYEIFRNIFVFYLNPNVPCTTFLQKGNFKVFDLATLKTI